MNKIKLEELREKAPKAKYKQIGNVRFSEETYNKIVEICKELGITKQWFIQQIVTDFIFCD
jgi:predicted DNA-binding protein